MYVHGVSKCFEFVSEVHECQILLLMTRDCNGFSCFSRKHRVSSHLSIRLNVYWMSNDADNVKLDQVSLILKDSDS